MGERVVFQIDSQECGSICLYSHWGGLIATVDLASALKSAEGRLEMGDYSYVTRIIVSALIGNHWALETGYGLYVGPDNSGEELYVINLDERTVTLPDYSTVSFTQLVEEG
jgi:hypothetical protein